MRRIVLPVVMCVMMCTGAGFTGAAAQMSQTLWGGWDLNQDDVITMEEVTALGMEGFKRVDANNDGQISMNELEEFERRVAANTEPPGVIISKSFDANQDGVITPDEMTAPVIARFSMMDMDRNNRITLQEIRQFKQQRTDQRKKMALERYLKDSGLVPYPQP